MNTFRLQSAFNIKNEVQIVMQKLKSSGSYKMDSMTLGLRIIAGERLHRHANLFFHST